MFNRYCTQGWPACFTRIDMLIRIGVGQLVLEHTTHRVVCLKVEAGH